MEAGVDLVVLGLGYIGLPLVERAVSVGLEVVGYDIDAEKVDALNHGHSYVDDLSDEDVRALVAQGFRATSDPALPPTATAVICVPTPLVAPGQPDLSAVEAAARTIAGHLRGGQLVILESTSYPGTTDEVVRPILEAGGLLAGTDFHLAFSPERIDPGNPTFGLYNTPKIVGGDTASCTDAAATFYGKLVETVVQTKGTREAEMAKLLENTYRHVNIALVNEMAIFSDELDIDLWDAIAAAATKPFGFEAFRPGAGVGGHCIPIDPNYLSFKVRSLGYAFRFVELAQEVNARMPAYVATRVQGMLNDQGKAVKGAKVLLLGVTYKANVADERESPARPLAKRLVELGADLTYHDPYIPAWRPAGTTYRSVTDLDRALAEADLVVLVQPHASYEPETLAEKTRLLFDTSGRASGHNVVKL